MVFLIALQYHPIFVPKEHLIISLTSSLTKKPLFEIFRLVKYCRFLWSQNVRIIPSKPAIRISFYSLCSENRLWYRVLHIHEPKKNFTSQYKAFLFAPYLYSWITKHNSRVLNTARGTGRRQMTRWSLRRVRRYDRLYMNHCNISTELNTLQNSHIHSISIRIYTFLP